MASTLEEINKKLLQINQQYEDVFNNPNSKRTLLNKKQFSLLFQQSSQTIITQKNICFCRNWCQLNQSQTQIITLDIVQDLYQELHSICRSNIFSALSKAYHLEDIEQILSEKWKNFKQFIFYYFALLQSANQFYENACIHANIQKGSHCSLNVQTSIFPIPVIALNYFKIFVLDPFKDKIQHIILHRIKEYRKNIPLKPESLKNLIQLVWCCGLGELARIKISPPFGIMLYRQEKTDYLKAVNPIRNPQHFFIEIIHRKILDETDAYYSLEYQTKIIALYPIQQFQAISQILKKEFQFSQSFFITKKQRGSYMAKVYENLVNQLPERLRVPGSLKSLIENYNYSSDEGFNDIKLYFDVLKDSAKISLKKFNKILSTIQAILTEVILEQGKQINLKINKRRCIRLKLDEERSLEKFGDVFLLLNCVASTDSFLIYHQQLMGKRIVESLNEPKLEYELLMLKKLSERMGVMSVSSHMSMIKDMEISQEMTEKYNNRLPFSSFKRSLKIFNPSFWPQNINRQKLAIQIPNYLLHQAKAIEQLYHTQNQYRYLNWKLQKGTSLFQGRYGTKKVRFQSENSYLMILLLIAEQPENKIIYGNLKQLVKIEKTGDESITKHDPLAMLVYVLIENRLVTRKNVEDRYAPFSQSQQLEINKNYTLPQNLSKGQQVVIIRPSQQMAKNLQQSSIQKGKIMKDRQKLIEAILVKVLKHAHATKDNSVTFAELYQAIKDHHVLGGFNFSQGIVKQKLQELIAREFCMRDQEDRKVYHYVA